MSYGLGQPVPLTINIRDTAGALADATTVTLTVTRPDGTPDAYTGAQLLHPSIGVYGLDYVPATAGLYTVRWMATGTNASAPTPDSFYVALSTAPPLVSLAEAREHLGLTATTDDAQVAWFVQVASDAAETHTGLIWRRTAIQATFDGGGDHLQLRRPVLSVTSVVQDGVTLPASSYVLDGRRGWLYRYGSWAWSSLAPQNITVAYVAGPVGGLIPDGVRQGALVMLQHLWETQRGASAAPRRGAGTEWTPGMGFSVPRRVQELWDPHSRALVA